MSFISYFVSKKPLPESTIKKAHDMHFSLNDITMFVKDAPTSNYKYYCFDPASIYITSTKFSFIRENPYDWRGLTLEAFYEWICEEFKQTGDFEYIQFFEDNTKIVYDCYEQYFKKCKQKDIKLSLFLEALPKTNALEDDTFYRVIAD